MATTTYTEFTAAARGIGNRTNSAGAAVGDISAEEDRLIQSILTEGYITTDAFKVNDGASGMQITVGSGSAKADLYAVAGEVAGQGIYLARLDQTPITITVPAAEASQVRNDEVYLVIADAAYDSGTRSLPRIGYRKGDPGGALPGPDASWKASVKLATVNVPAAASTISAGNITDNRVAAQLTAVPPNLATESYVDNAVAAVPQHFIGAAHDGSNFPDSVVLQHTFEEGKTYLFFGMVTYYKEGGDGAVQLRINLDYPTRNMWISNDVLQYGHMNYSSTIMGMWWWGPVTAANAGTRTVELAFDCLGFTATAMVGNLALWEVP